MLFVQTIHTFLKKKTAPYILFICFFTGLLLFTRFVNIGWGLPYPMHPDERNMVMAMQRLECNPADVANCYNPEFFAYGQLPLYIAYIGLRLFHFASGSDIQSVMFEESTIALRIIAAVASVATAIFLWRSMRLLAVQMKPGNVTKAEESFYDRLVYATGILFIFSPIFIQFAHYGTTESLLMMFYAALAYLSLLVLQRKIARITYVFLCGIFVGAAVATKVSGLVYLSIPGIVFLYQFVKDSFTVFHLYISGKKPLRFLLQLLTVLLATIRNGILFGLITIFFSIILSPYNTLAFTEFWSSMQYESSVGFGTTLVFYTRSFFETAPVFFQAGVIFPYVLGIPVFMLFILGFIFLPWRSKEYLLLRFMFIMYFVPQAFVYAKWTRFIAPVFPITVLIAACFVLFLYKPLLSAAAHITKGFAITKVFFALLIVVSVIPGIAFLSVYTRPDVRYTASNWIYNNIPEGSILLAETANVIDIPILQPPETVIPRSYNYISFDFYNLDTDFGLQDNLKKHWGEADYVIVNSRRVFKNHTCLEANSFPSKALISIDQKLPLPIYTPIYDQKERCRQLALKYPQLQSYYEELFNGEDFRLVAEFTSYPQIRLFGVPILELPDENAEETWTVFDHPVIRIYKRVDSASKSVF